MPKRKTYGNESISSLKGADRVRKRPAVIFGSDGIDGCQHSVFEILSNSIDEAREGYGDKIVITRFLDKSIEVVDKGRGIPVDYNKTEEKFNWELLFCEMYAGGKYNNSEDDIYEYSLGLNGLGLCATQYASEYMDVEVKRDGTVYTLHFEKGENMGGLMKKPYKGKETGSRIRWRPDNQVFTDTNIPIDYFRDVLKRQSIVNNGLTFILRNETTHGFEEETFFYLNGISDYVREVGGDDTLTSVLSWSTEDKGKDREDKPEYKVKLNAAVCFSNKVTMCEYYHNSSYLEYGGAPEKAVKSAFVSEIDGYLKKNSKYRQGESKITFQDIEDCLIIVISSFSTQTSYENQTKKAITNKFIQEATTKFLKNSLEVFFVENPMEAEKVASQVLINKRSREEAEKSRLNIKKKLTSNLDLTNKVEKFVDCRSKDNSERELYIVEGDSALGSCKQARDPNFQAVIPIRGKILNCLKADYNKIFRSEIITDLCKVLGCGVEVVTKANKNLSNFDINNLRWNKVVICTDADYDGFQIRALVLTMIYRLMPTLIEKEKVFIAESPLFELTTKDKTYFAYTETEKTKIISMIGNTKFDIQRSKGLGENDPEMMSLTTMNPSTRRLIKVTPTNINDTSVMFDVLLGNNLEERKKYIEENGQDYLELLDVE